MNQTEVNGIINQINALPQDYQRVLINLILEMAELSHAGHHDMQQEQE